MDDDPSYQITVTPVVHDAPPCAGRLAEIAAVVLQMHGASAARLNIALVGDDQISQLHQQHLECEGPTDVLTFDLSDDQVPFKDSLAIEGEIVISVHTARRESKERGHSLEAELCLYVVHGLLHLIGFEDGDPRSAARMHEEEDKLLTLAGVGSTYGSESR